MTAAKVKPEESVFRHLPLMYRRAGREGEPAWALLSAFGKGIGDLERLSRQVMKAHYLEHVNDLNDLERLAALFELAPWPEENLDAFRFRVRQMGRIYLEGSATANRLLEVLGAACNADLTATTPPEHESNDRYTTTGAFQRRDGTETFTADVVDAPEVTRHQEVTAPFEWQVESNLYADPGGIAPDGTPIPATFPDPVVDIVAGAHPVVCPVLIQRDLRRLVLINRFIPPGATLRVDLVHHQLIDVDGPATLEGPVRYTTSGGTVLTPPLLYGSAGLIADAVAGQLTGTATGSTRARPFHVIRWNPQIIRGPAMVEVPGPPGSLLPVPPTNIPWPPLVPLGASRWRLMVGVNPEGWAPALEETLSHLDIRVRPVPEDGAPASLRFHWTGRRLATFTIRFDEAQLCSGPSATGSMKHRADWLHQQIERLKLAGVIYLNQHEFEAGIPPVDADRPPWLSLWETTRPGDAQGAAKKPKEKAVTLLDSVTLVDKLSVSVSKRQPPRLDLTDTLTLGDSLLSGASNSKEALLMASEQVAVHGRLVLEVFTPDGTRVGRVEGSNTVVDGGRALLALLLSGQAQEPRFAAVAGISEKETTGELEALYEPDGLEPIPVEEMESKEGIIQLQVSFPPAEKERFIREAGLMLTCNVGGDEVTALYNRVMVRPAQAVRKEEILTVTWTLTFAPQTA